MLTEYPSFLEVSTKKDQSDWLVWVNLGNLYVSFGTSIDNLQLFAIFNAMIQQQNKETQEGNKDAEPKD